MDHKNAYQQKMTTQMREWSVQIDLLEAKMDNVGADIKLRRVEELRILRARQLAVTEKMYELGRSSGHAWEQVKLTADQLWADLMTGIGQAQAKFK